MEGPLLLVSLNPQSYWAPDTIELSQALSEDSRYRIPPGDKG